MIKAALEYLLNLGKVERFEINGRQYADRELEPIMPSGFERFGIHTLTGLIDIVKLYHEIKMESIIHILNSKKIIVYSLTTDEWQRRECFCVAEPIEVYKENKYYMAHEEFMIRLQTEFIYDTNVALLLEKVGTMILEDKTEYLDDGVTPRIITRKGINLKKETDLPPRIKLRPFRTFQEIEQPEAEFILRINNDDKPKIALIESSGTAWQYEAIKLISEYMQTIFTNLGIVDAKIIA